MSMLWAEWFRVQIPLEARGVSLLQHVETGSGAHQASILYILGLFLAGKVSGF
jgi:hypothetical protein